MVLCTHIYHEETRKVYSINELSHQRGKLQHKINILIFQEFLHAKICPYLDDKVTWFEVTYSCVNIAPQLCEQRTTATEMLNNFGH